MVLAEGRRGSKGLAGLGQGLADSRGESVQKTKENSKIEGFLPVF
jgi:hypothetical protein